MSGGNSLQAMLDRANPKPSEPETPATPRASRSRPIDVLPAANEPKAAKPEKGPTKLIGGHFAPEVSAQLRIIAAEDGTTIQRLLAEALDDLFVKKGKARLANV